MKCGNHVGWILTPEFSVGMPMSTQMCLGTRIWHCTSLCISVCASVYTHGFYKGVDVRSLLIVRIRLTNSERSKLCCTKPSWCFTKQVFLFFNNPAFPIPYPNSPGKILTSPFSVGEGAAFEWKSERYFNLRV